MRLGFHIPYSGNLKLLTSHVKHTKGNSFQFFSRTIRGGRLPEIKDSQIIDYYEFLIKNNIYNVVLHSPRTINLTVDDEAQRKSLIEDLEYANLVQARYYVIFPGRRKKLDKEKALENVKKNLSYLLNYTNYTGKIVIRN